MPFKCNWNNFVVPDDKRAEDPPSLSADKVIQKNGAKWGKAKWSFAVFRTCGSAPDHTGGTRRCNF